jgi:NhaP-type Na+/H+ or K+/H+ antiporter
MDYPQWYLVIGALLVLVVLVEPRVRRLPISTAIIYLCLGWLFAALGWLEVNPLSNPRLWERLSEVAVIVSLFSAGLKLRKPLNSKLWRLPVALAFGSMMITVGLITAAAMALFDLPLGAAVILGAVLAPTDPVLASDVQVVHAQDTDRVRFTLTGEAGLNDGTAFPFLVLGLGLLGEHDLGAYGWRWIAVDVAWATVGGLAIGAILGMAVGRFVIYLRQMHREAVGLDDFLALGLIALAYGGALTAHAYGFLAVFAAGLALRTVERHLSPKDAPEDVKAIARSEKEVTDHPEQMPAYMAEAVLRFNEQLEHIGELALVLIVGAMVHIQGIPLNAVGFAAILFCLIRPAAVAPLAYLAGMNRMQIALVSWFGVRGVGSLYYLFYAMTHGVPEDTAALLTTITLSVVSLSVVLHGISVTPLMNRYQAFNERRTARMKS